MQVLTKNEKSLLRIENIVAVQAVEGNWSKPMEWCSQNIKSTDWHYLGEGVFKFEHKIDLTYFMLVWS